MITENDWREALAKCQAVNKPNENAYLLLAAATYMTEREEHLSRTPNTENHMFSASLVASYDSGTEFSETIKGKEITSVLRVVDELSANLQTFFPKMYAGFMRKLNEI